MTENGREDADTPEEDKEKHISDYLKEDKSTEEIVEQIRKDQEKQEEKDKDEFLQKRRVLVDSLQKKAEKEKKPENTDPKPPWLMTEKREKTNGKKKRNYKLRALLALGLTGLFAFYGLRNLWDMHTFDKYVCRHIEIAANVPSAGRTAGLSMESALTDAKKNLGVSRLENPAIIWETPVTDTGALEDLISKAIERTRQIQAFKDSYNSKEEDENWPDWVKDAYKKLKLSNALNGLNAKEKSVVLNLLPSLEELSESEYGQRIASEYEAVNNVIAGGTRISAKSLQERHNSLLDTLERAAGWRSIIRFQADDYKEAFARVFVGYLYANMGYLDESIDNFKVAKRLMDEYPDDKNLAIWRKTPDMEQSTIKGLINSSIRELEALNKDPTKYSTGWWKRLIYYNQSIGGQMNPSISDVADNIYYRYRARAMYSGVIFLIGLFFSGLYVKRFRKARKYEVKHEEKKGK